MKHRVLISTIAAVLTACASTPSSVEWPTYHHDAGGTRYSPLKQITPDNVAKLQVAWTYHMRPENAGPEAPPVEAGDAPPPMFRGRYSISEATPLVAGGRMFLPTPYGRVVALDPESGRELWVHELPDRDQASMRGVEYWPGGDGAEPAIFFGTRRGKLMGLSAATGEPLPNFGENGVVDMKTPEVMNDVPRAPLGMSSPPLTYKNLIITGSRVQEMPVIGAAGDVRAWDARTGKLVWTFHTIPRPGEPGHETWEGDSWKRRSGTNVWTFFVLDEERGILYMPVGAPTFDRWGGDRKGSNLYANSIVAVDALTGKYLWHFQTVHHDIWDLDLPAATLLDVKKDGKTIPAIGVMNKTAMLFLLNRVTGEPIYEVKEVPVPTDTDIEGESPWPTQPMPVAPPPLARLEFKMSDLADITPEHRAFCEQLIKEKNIVESRLFQPLRGDSAVASFPGSLGGVDWGGGAFDPKSGLYIVNTNDLAGPQQMAKRPDGSWGLKEGYVYFWNPKTRLPCQQPPWGSLYAVDVNKGTIAWRSTLGVSDNLPEGLQNTGRISAGGPIVTGGGLIFIGATDDSRIRAFDTKSGKELWTFKLPASNYGTPITYQSRGGKQHVAVIATGGFSGDPVRSDSVISFSLPQ
jgi:quinoprotein glucose dehydrogenase